MSCDDATNFLSAPDQKALDALMNTGLDRSASPDDRARFERVQAVLALAAGPSVNPSPGLADRVLASVIRSSSGTPAATGTPKLAITHDVDGPELTPDDEEALDAYVMAGYRLEKVPSSLRQRAVQIEKIGALLTGGGGVHQSADLAQRTLAAIRRAGSNRTATGVHPTTGRSGGFRFVDLVSIAAAVVLGVSVLWPVLATYRVHSSRAACAANMATVAGGFGRYAGDFRDALPMAAASLGGAWWDVGTTPERSNAANLFQLPRQQYVRPVDLACAGNPKADRGTSCSGRSDWTCHESVSYSYHVMFGAERPQWGERSAVGPMVILVDKSPVIARARRGEIVNPFENSPNHAGAGQWALRTDGSAVWLKHPQLGEDNIWLPGVIDAMVARARKELARGTPAHQIRINGNELPVSRSETFVGP